MALAPAALAFIDGLGGPEMVLIFVVILVLFGGQKLPEFARGLGKTMREFKKAAAGVEDEFKRALDEDERKKFAPPPPPPAPLTIQPVAALSADEAANAAADQDSATEPLDSNSDPEAGTDQTLDEQSGLAPTEDPAAEPAMEPSPEAETAPTAEPEPEPEPAPGPDPDEEEKRKPGNSPDSGLPPA